MSIRCPECGFVDNRDDALICENCGFKFLEVVLEEELFFVYEEGKTLYARTRT
jgi:hypothetical protein